MVVGLALSSVFGYLWWQDRPVNQALAASAAAVDPVLDQLTSAESLADVSGAGASAPKAAATVDEVLADIKDEDGELAAAARDLLAGQQLLLESIAPMEGLSEESLTVWGTTLPDVQEAQSSLLASRRALGELDGGAPDRVTDPRKATNHAIEIVGAAATASLTTELEGLINELDSVSNTREAAVLGERAALSEETAAAAALGQQGDPAETLGALNLALGALGSLARMDPESLYVWGNAKSDLSSSTRTLGVDSSGALDSMSAWVRTAQKEMDAWEADSEEAQKARSATTADLDEYSESMRRILRDYDRARDATADALEAAELDDYSASYEVEEAMESGVRARQELLNEVQFLSVPGDIGSAHQGLIGVLEAAVEAMVTGEQAVEDWNACYLECPPTYRDMEGWREFSRASGDITTRFDRSRKDWDAALASALRSANAVPLPPIPKV